MLILAGWFDFGIGDAIKGISDATWKVMLIKAIERSFPSLILMASIIGAIAAAIAAAYLVSKFCETGRDALRDDKVTVAEWCVIGLQAVVVIPISTGLAYFAFFLMQASHSGLSELMK